ncbi:hypothetical protein NDU88_001937 [Pleurodeles waltl]|uniref:Uncharacterized protein n=1 Tax=Pleurodeles waltl TaxID=8319 RepID=A0AAV7T155_PLEWA|nr:hypothetical protein NDU88_001937 [Pleurodeles waltl]
MPRFYAGNCLGNPDIRVPERTEKEDGLCARRAKEEQNAYGDEENGGTKDRSNAENSEETLEENGQPRVRKGAEERKLRHVPGGTWLTKVSGASAGKNQSGPLEGGEKNAEEEQGRVTGNTAKFKEKVKRIPRFHRTPKSPEIYQSIERD